MSNQIFKRRKLSAVLSAAAAGLLLAASSVHSQTISGSAGADGNSGKDASSQVDKSSGASASGSSGSSARNSGASGSSGSTASDSKSTSGSSGAAGKISKSDRDMMQKIAQANIAEIETAKLAQEKSKNDEVREFAKKMVDDHTKAQEDLEKIAQSKDVKLPSEPDAKHQAAIKKLSDLSEEEFDKRYVAQAGLSDHRDAHRLLERVSKQAKDDDLKQYAAKTVAAVDEHWKMAKAMKSSQGAATSSGSSSGKSDSSAGASSAKPDSTSRKTGDSEKK